MIFVLTFYLVLKNRRFSFCIFSVLKKGKTFSFSLKTYLNTLPYQVYVDEFPEHEYVWHYADLWILSHVKYLQSMLHICKMNRWLCRKSIKTYSAIISIFFSSKRCTLCNDQDFPVKDLSCTFPVHCQGIVWFFLEKVSDQKTFHFISSLKKINLCGKPRTCLTHYGSA